MTDPLRTELDIRTACACSAVAIAVRGRARAMFLCGCNDCRTVTGTGHSATAMFAADDVTVSGETTAFRRPAESGATVTRRFCPRCGTTLCAETTRAPGQILVPAGLLGGDGWYRPSRMIFGTHPLDWDTLPETIPRHSAYREKDEP